MSTLHHIDMALVDIRDRLTKELQFSVDSERQVCQAIDTVSEAINQLERAVKSAFAERHRALASALGSPGPSPETIDASDSDAPARKPKLVKHGAAS